ncbi:hypothetical protein G5S35_17555 [Paraburkholderia tropica]|uniref:hypothetical protein n=1 Tax=Paraburkholderia tropica TaxID=92647 RepID=UPI001600BCFF|nr:hypothetical protein [Paraburkholderia tropica]QNB13436.1 hypothetical protein G5S35_17555 [Paraburkholderia tropica]
MSDPTARASYRAALLAVLTTVPGVNLYSPGDWNLAAPKLPALKLRYGREEKASKGPNGQTAFDTISAFEMRVEVSAKSGPLALLALEAIQADIEAAIFKSVALRNLTQDFVFMRTETDVSSEGEAHVGVMAISLGVQMFETFYPDVTAQLTEIDLTADLINVYDPTGTYDNPPFPDAVTPAPRTEGPDGRAEGFVKATFT